VPPLASALCGKRKLFQRSPNRSDALAILFREMDYAKLTAKPNLSACPDMTQLLLHFRLQLYYRYTKRAVFLKGEHS
jgi:hypothetical protein